MTILDRLIARLVPQGVPREEAMRWSITRRLPEQKGGRLYRYTHADVGTYFTFTRAADAHRLYRMHYETAPPTSGDRPDQAVAVVVAVTVAVAEPTLPFQSVHATMHTRPDSPSARKRPRKASSPVRSADS